MMWRAHNFNIPQTLDSWSDSELEDWRASFLKQSEVIPMSPPPDLSVIASDMPPITEPHSYNYRLHLPPAPVAFGARLSPALSSTSSAYLDPGAVNGYINESNQGPTSAGFDTIISSTNLYDPRCPSPWTDVTSSPVPSSNYPNPSTIKKSIDGNIPRSTSIQENGAAPTPASLHDASFSSPWTDVTPSSVPTGETTCTTVSSKRPSQAKLPCRSRRLASKKKLVYPCALRSVSLHYLNTFRQ